jgi:hypothetical protein
MSRVEILQKLQTIAATADHNSRVRPNSFVRACDQLRDLYTSVRELAMTLHTFLAEVLPVQTDPDLLLPEDRPDGNRPSEK